MITQDDLHALASWMIAEHGPRARDLANLAIGEMQALEDERGLMHWSALGGCIGDMLDGHMSKERVPTQH